jgi:hypothetical protein
VSVNRQVTDRLNPYIEAYWFSRPSPGGRRLLSTDLGLIYTLNERLAVDGGFEMGLSHAAPRRRVFGGLTVILGEAFGHEGVHARLKAAAEQHAGRSQ